jgi:hypothetical protein
MKAQNRQQYEQLKRFEERFKPAPFGSGTLKEECGNPAGALACEAWLTIFPQHLQ